METTVNTCQSNRRRSQRGKARSSVKVQCRKGSHGLGADLALALLDISDSGVRLLITKPLDLMIEVEVLISGYGMKGLIRLLGNVRWQVKLETGQFCVGVEFQKRLAYRDWGILSAPK